MSTSKAESDERPTPDVAPRASGCSTLRSADTPEEAAEARHRAGLLFLFAEDDAFPSDPWFFRRDRLTVGRGPENDIRLDDATISRRHAEIVLTDRGWAVRDLGSKNGIQVDGVPTRASSLTRGCIVRFGDLLFKFVDRELEFQAIYRNDGRLRGNARRLGPHDSRLIGGWEMDRLAERLERVGRSDLTVLLLGESGTGKEIAAGEIHRASRRKGAFVAVNCAAIPTGLLESELFGHRRGAFSGASANKTGLLQSANEGTLFLDEIGDMPLESQVKLLRVLQTHAATPLGAVTPEHVDVRVVAATHQDLTAAQESGAFRRDLYARLSEFVVRLPPLRERKEEIVMLTRTFLARRCRRPPRLSIGFVAELLSYDWPYNVRELENCIKRSATVMDGDWLKRRDLPESVLRRAPRPPNADGAPIIDARTDGRAIAAKVRANTPNEQELRTLLSIHRGNVSVLARQLGKARMQVHRWLARYSLDPEEFRDPAGEPSSDPEPETFV